MEIIRHIVLICLMNCIVILFYKLGFLSGKYLISNTRKAIFCMRKEIWMEVEKRYVNLNWVVWQSICWWVLDCVNLGCDGWIEKSSLWFLLRKVFVLVEIEVICKFIDCTANVMWPRKSGHKSCLVQKKLINNQCEFYSILIQIRILTNVLS